MNHANNEPAGATHIGWLSKLSESSGDLDHLVLTQKNASSKPPKVSTQEFKDSTKLREKPQKASKKEEFLEVNDAPVDSPVELLGALDKEDGIKTDQLITFDNTRHQASLESN